MSKLLRLAFVHESKKHDVKDARGELNKASLIFKSSKEAMQKAKDDLKYLKKSLKDFEQENPSLLQLP